MWIKSILLIFIFISKIEAFIIECLDGNMPNAKKNKIEKIITRIKPGICRKPEFQQNFPPADAFENGIQILLEINDIQNVDEQEKSLKIQFEIVTSWKESELLTRPRDLLGYL